VESIKGRRKTQRLNITRSNIKLHNNEPEITLKHNHFMDGLKSGTVDESTRERSQSLEKHKHKLSEKEEELFKLLSDKYNRI